MPDIVQQTWEEKHDEESTVVGWIIKGPTDAPGVLTSLLAVIPATYDYRVLNKLESMELLPGRLDMWRVMMRYSMFAEKRELQTGEMEFKFHTGSAQARRTISISSRVFDADGEITDLEDAPDAQLIGFKRPLGPAEGVMVEENTYGFGWTVIVPFGTASESWRRQVGELRGTTNSDPFFAYPANEVKFEDWSGGVRGKEDYRLELQFSRKPSYETLTVGGIELTDVGGWEYIDADAMEFVTDPKGRPVPKVSRVKLHQVFPSADWSLLADLLGFA